MGGRKRVGFRVAALLLSGITLPVEPRADDGPTGAIDAALLTCAVTAHCADLAMSPDEALEFLEMSPEQAKGAYEKQIGPYQEEAGADKPDGSVSGQSSDQSPVQSYGQQDEESEAGSVDQALLTCAVEADCSDLAMSPDEALEFLEMSPEQVKELHDEQIGLSFDEADAPVEPSPSDVAAVNDGPTQEGVTSDGSDPEGGATEEGADAGNKTRTEEPINFEESDLQASDKAAIDDMPTSSPLDFDQKEGIEVGTNRTAEDSLLRCASGFGCDEVSDYIKPEDAAIFLDDEQRKIMCAAGQGCVDNFEHYTPEQMRKELGLTQDEALEEFAKRVGEKPEYIDPSNGASDEELMTLCMYYQKKLLPGAYAIPSYRTQLEYSCKEWIAAGWRSSKKVIDQIFAQ